MNRSQVLVALENTQWVYALNDQAHALQDLAKRIARTGRLNRSLTASPAVLSPVTFDVSTINN